MKCFNIRKLDDELHKRIKIQAAEESKGMEEYIIDAIKKELERKQ